MNSILICCDGDLGTNYFRRILTIEDMVMLYEENLFS